VLVTGLLFSFENSILGHNFKTKSYMDIKHTIIENIHLVDFYKPQLISQ